MSVEYLAAVKAVSMAFERVDLKALKMAQKMTAHYCWASTTTG